MSNLCKRCGSDDWTMRGTGHHPFCSECARQRSRKAYRLKHPDAKVRPARRSRYGGELCGHGHNNWRTYSSPTRIVRKCIDCEQRCAQARRARGLRPGERIAGSGKHRYRSIERRCCERSGLKFKWIAMPRDEEAGAIGTPAIIYDEDAALLQADLLRGGLVDPSGVVG